MEQLDLRDKTRLSYHLFSELHRTKTRDPEKFELIIIGILAKYRMIPKKDAPVTHNDGQEL